MRSLKLSWVILAFLFININCDDSSDKILDTDNLTDRPEIPVPTSYAAAVPEYSESIIVETAPLSNMIAKVDSAILIGCGPPGNDYPCSLYYLNPDYNRIKLIIADSIVTEYDTLSTQVSYNGVGWGDAGLVPLSSRPYLRLSRYWVRLGPVDRYSGSTSRTITRTTTRGLTETHAEEFTKTLGVEASVSGGWFVDFEVTVRSEFSWSSSHETSISQEESYEESFTVSCPENKNLVYCVWQLYDEYQVVDSSGNIFTDPNYKFDVSSLKAVIPTDELVPMTTYFNSK